MEEKDRHRTGTRLVPAETLQKWRILLLRYMEDPRPGYLARTDLEEIAEEIQRFQEE